MRGISILSIAAAKREAGQLLDSVAAIGRKVDGTGRQLPVRERVAAI